jgi:hypothetical protein
MRPPVRQALGERREGPLISAAEGASRALAGALLLGGSASRAQSNDEPPHAWLFGAWIGGMFPPPSEVTAKTCLAQPTVIFTRDVVLRAVLTDTTYAQRQVATVRATAHGFEFRFEAPLTPASTGGGLLGLGGESQAPAAVGFGCESPDVLHVERRGENEIAFPGCEDFPNPLVRCPAS